MTRTYRIVAGVDGSDAGLRALRWAFRQAAALDGTVQAVTAWTYDASNATDVGYADQQREEAEGILSTAISQALSDNPRVTIVPEVVVGRPAHVLVTAARDADVLVLGSHGHSRLFHAVLGSVADECIRTAGCPVVIVPVPRPLTTGTAEASQLSTTAS